MKTYIDKNKDQKPDWKLLLFIIVVLAAVFLSGSIFAENMLSNDAFQRLTKDIQYELDLRHKAAQTTDEVFPGATAAFILSDGRMAKFATGYSDIETKTAMSPETLMPAGSIGKTYVAAVVMSMVSDGMSGS